VLAFSDDDALAALEAITKRRPQVVALERLFAATSRGAALINRIKADPALSFTEIRVVSHDGEYSRVSPRRSVPVPVAAPGAPEAPPPQLDYRGTRRAPRFRMNSGTEAQVDGASALLVDLSTAGAQVVAQAALRPNQRVRITLADDAGVVRFNASVAWASFEIPKGVTRYRAGIEFKDAKPEAVEAFTARHKI
jgi:PilZ domain